MSTIPFAVPEAIDSAFIRKITGKLLAVAAEMAVETENVIDDQIVATAQSLLEKDLLWGILVRIIARNTPASAEELSSAVISGFGDADKPEAVDIAAIITLLQIAIPAVQALWQAFRNWRKPAPVPTPGPVTV